MYSPKSFGMQADYNTATLAKLDLPYEDSKKFSSWLQSPAYFCIILGTPGTGKSYTCAAVLNDKWSKTKNVRYFRVTNFLQYCRTAIDIYGNYEFEVARLSDCKYFILDDLGSNKGSDWQVEVLTTLIDERLGNGSTKATLITSNLTPEQMIAEYGERFHSRIFDKRNLIIHHKGVDRRLSRFENASRNATLNAIKREEDD